MAFPLASTPWAGSHPNPPYSGTFIPELWSVRMIAKYYAATVLSEIANTDYEGEIRNFGDTVHIRQVPDITVRNYTIDQALAVDRFSAPKISLLIDRGKYVHMAINDVYRAQSDINLFEMLTTAASNELRIEIDRDVLGGIYSGIAAANRGNTAGILSGNVRLGAAGSPLVVKTNPSAVNEVDPLRLILRLNLVLDEYNVPREGRWCVIPPWMAQLLKPSDLKDASLTGDRRSPLRTGLIGAVDATNLYISTLLPTATESGKTVNYIFAGYRDGISFASQLTKVEDLPNPTDFGILARMLQVYGFKVTKPEALAAAYAYGEL